MAGTSSPEQCRTRSSHRSLMLLLTLLAVQQQMQLSAAQVPDRVRQPGKIAVNPTAGESDEEGSMNARGQLQANGATIFAPAGPAMLNGVKVTSANFNKLAQQTPTTPSPPAKKASTLTPAGTIAGSTAAASTATSTPGLVNVRTSGTSGAALVNSAVSNPGTAGSGTFNTVQGGQTTSVAGQFAQQAPASAGTTRSAGTAGGAGGSGGSGGARLAGSVTSVAGGRKLLVNPLHLVVS